MKAIYLILLTAVLSLTSCTSEETKKYEKIKTSYYEIINATYADDKLISDAEYVKRQINDFMKEYSESKYRIELENFKDNIEEEVYRIALKQFHKEFEIFNNKTYSDYEEYKINLDEIQSKTMSFLTKFPSGQNTYEIKEIKGKLDNIETNLLREKMTYDELVNSFQERYTFDEANQKIQEIRTFIEIYPSSIRRNYLETRIERLEFLKFKLEARTSVETIYELNNLIETFKRYKNKLNSSYHSDIDDKINAFENKRSQIFRSEFNNDLSTLLDRAYSSAKTKAKEIHWCEILSVYDKSNDYDNVGNRREYTFYYTFKMKGDLWCANTYLTKVVVEGTIEGDEQNGVNWNITSTGQISDTQISN